MSLRVAHDLADEFPDGQLGEGRADLADAAAIFSTLGDAAGIGTVFAVNGLIDRLDGMTPSAFVQFERATSELANAGNPGAFALAARYLGQAHLAVGHGSDAETWFAGRARCISIDRRPRR